MTFARAQAIYDRAEPPEPLDSDEYDEYLERHKAFHTAEYEQALAANEIDPVGLDEWLSYEPPLEYDEWYDVMQQTAHDEYVDQQIEAMKERRLGVF